MLTPPPLNFAATDQGRALLDADENTVLSVPELSHALREHAESWEDHMKGRLRAVIAEDLGMSLDSFESDPLDLAVGTYWKCLSCPYLLEYPGLLRHACPASAAASPGRQLVVSGSRLPMPLVWGSFPAPGIYLKSTAQFVNKLLALCGGDPHTTAAQLDCERFRFLAVGGSHLADHRAIMTWRAAVRYIH